MATHSTPVTSAVQESVQRVCAELTSLLAILGEISPREAVDAVAAIERAGRLVDAARVRAAAPLVGDMALIESLAFTSPTAAIAALCGIREASARCRVRIATSVSDDLTITGAPLPAPCPTVRDALDAGTLGMDAASLIVDELRTVRGRVDRHALGAAEVVMVERATGISSNDERFSGVVSVDFLATELRQITSTIDPDGARPREVRAARKRALRIGQQDCDGTIPINGRLLPEVGLLLAGLVEAHRRSPRFTLLDEHRADPDQDAAQHDGRTPDQRRHDIFAEIIGLAASAEGAPELDGSPVTVLVTVSAEDLRDPRDGLSTAGDPIGLMADSRFPVSRGTIERFIDAQGFRTVTQSSSGRVTSMSSRQRCFTSTQRLAIAARDGARCATIGCSSATYTLQAHHVIPFREGGATHVDNGILLCFWHHQQVDTGPWSYRMVGGIPHVRGPGMLEWTARRPPVPASRHSASQHSVPRHSAFAK